MQTSFSNTTPIYQSGMWSMNSVAPSYPSYAPTSSYLGPQDSFSSGYGTNPSGTYNAWDMGTGTASSSWMNTSGGTMGTDSSSTSSVSSGTGATSTGTGLSSSAASTSSSLSSPTTGTTSTGSSGGGARFIDLMAVDESSGSAE